jgi:integrase/recombinase XerC
MPLLKLDRLCDGLEKGDWAGFLRDWDRALRAGNHPETTRYNYLLAAAQLAKYLTAESADPDADDAGQDPTLVTKAHVESFQAWMIETRSASTALNLSSLAFTERVKEPAVQRRRLTGRAERGRVVSSA